ncbi:DUF2264 domain-containing protein [Gorillibacterium sp. sgz5001074]|uniref:DUF2264 domain-containing protein n=1 Tax=Gorillibacterium sp. sgz5001074 TaxID=3446695 RepID=UPI003F666175
MAHPNMHPVHTNPLLTRQDLAAALKGLCGSVQPYYSEGFARLELAGSGAAYPPRIAGFEGFSRLLWGLAPLLAGGGFYEHWSRHLTGIKNGTDPQHEEYWGDLNDYDQRLVEMAAFGLSLVLAPEAVWEPLSEREKSNLAAWLTQINRCKLWDCNWLFFAVLVNLGLRSVGQPYDRERMEECLTALDAYYLSDGWYSDGDGGHCDYYGPFAIHYYGLFYAKVMEKEDPERSRLYKSRAEEFARDFIHWFAEDGSALPYGRSLSYRFAMSSFWGMAVYAGIEPFPIGVMKGLLLRNLRWWFQRPIFHTDGTLTVGYAYPNLIMAENYNSPGSPYWAFKSFLPLALGEDHPFWTAEELPMPDLPPVSVQKPPHLVLLRRDSDRQVLAFNSGHPSSNEHTHTSAKYEKFVYSNVFGFSVPRAEWGLAQGAFDSMLALSEGDNLYRVKRRTEASEVSGEMVYAVWRPWSDVSVRTWILPGLPWHVRIHRIESGRPLDAADGGFALGLEDSPYHTSRGQVTESDAAVSVRTVFGTCAAAVLWGNGAPALVQPHSNTSVMFPRTVIPTVKVSLETGTSWLVTAFYGSGEGAPDDSAAMPVAAVHEGRLSILRPDGSPWFSMDME